MKKRSKTLRKVGSLGVAATALNCVLATGVHAFPIDAGQDWQIRWDTTVQYSDLFRVAPVNQELVTTNPNTDDGDRNLRSGFVSNRIDVLSEFDAVYNNMYGFRTSVAGWYDTIYNNSNGNNSPGTINHYTTAPNDFSQETRNIEGRNIDLLDAFVFTNQKIGDDPITIRAGRHTVIYGETLFFGANGIANAQSATDVIKALSVPNTTFKDLILPIGQISGVLQLQHNVTIGAYWQVEYRPNRLPGSGSYFSSNDVVGNGDQTLILQPGGPQSPIVALSRIAPIAPTSGIDQGGGEIKWSPEGMDLDLGLYAAIYDDKNPQAYIYLAGVTPGIGAGPLTATQFGAGNFRLVYPRHIQSYGVSASTNIGDANVAGEISFRVNAPLVSDPQVVTFGGASNASKPIYAIGDTFHFNFSTIYIAPESRFWNSASILGEIGGNAVLDVTKNPLAVDPNTSKWAVAMRAVFTPSYYQVLPSLDLAFPIGLGFNPHGNSRAVAGFNGGEKLGGDATIGISATYAQVWRASLAYTNYFGTAGSSLTPNNLFSFKQAFADRDFLSFSLSRSF